MFTNIFGLGDLWTNRGKWYLIIDDELDIVMKNLMKLKAFDDEFGVSQHHVKIKAYSSGFTAEEGFYYMVKIPNWVFKYEKHKLDDAAKAEMLGIKLR